MEVKAIRILTWLVLGVLMWISPVTSQDPNDCSFDPVGGEISSCNLILDMKAFAVADWKMGVGEQANWIGGPPTDNTGSPTGGYGLTTTTDMFNSKTYHKKSWMLTGISNATGATGKCLSFAYATHGLSLASLEILLIGYNVENPEEVLENGTDTLVFQKTTLWKKVDTTKGEWKTAKVSFSAAGSYSLAFAAEPNFRFSYSRGYAAVDDIVFADGSCENECMFDSDTCNWSNDVNDDDFDWSLARSSTKRGTGPSRDQPSSLNKQIVTGGYAYIDSGYPRQSGDKARLVSDTLNASTSPLCVRFWLNMHGGGVGDVRVLYSPDSNSNVTTELWKLWTDDGTTNFGTDNWYPCQQTVSSPEPFRLIFEATVGFPGAGDIGLDTITLSQNSCPSLPAGSNSGWGDCTFLDDTCGWTLPTGDSGSCTMLERIAENSYNPPGHTESAYQITDMYMKFDLGCYRNQARERAAMVSTSFSLTTTNCLSFWVYMYTTVATQIKFGALSVLLIEGGRNTTIWRLQNQQQAGWTYAQVPIPPGSSQSVAIEATKGPNVIGMIGVDDITVFPSNCIVEPAVAGAEPADCTFDSGPCLYTIHNANTASDSQSENWRFAIDGEVVVVRDHTFEADQGGFMFMDSFNTDLKSRLRSPQLDVNQTYCFTFFFTSFYQDNAAKLSVYRDASGTGVLLWTATQATLPPRPTSNQQVKWHYAQVELDDQSAPYEVYIEGEVRVGGWAVDDIKLIKDAADCKTRPDSAAPN